MNVWLRDRTQALCEIIHLRERFLFNIFNDMAYWALSSLGKSLFFENSFTTNWITFFENYLHMMLNTGAFFFISYKLAKLDEITFHCTEMAGKSPNLNLIAFKKILISQILFCYKVVKNYSQMKREWQYPNLKFALKYPNLRCKGLDRFE